MLCRMFPQYVEYYHGQQKYIECRFAKCRGAKKLLYSSIFGLVFASVTPLCIASGLPAFCIIG